MSAVWGSSSNPCARPVSRPINVATGPETGFRRNSQVAAMATVGSSTG